MADGDNEVQANTGVVVPAPTETVHPSTGSEITQPDTLSTVKPWTQIQEEMSLKRGGVADGTGTGFEIRENSLPTPEPSVGGSGANASLEGESQAMKAEVHPLQTLNEQLSRAGTPFELTLKSPGGLEVVGGTNGELSIQVPDISQKLGDIIDITRMRQEVTQLVKTVGQDNRTQRVTVQGSVMTMKSLLSADLEKAA